MRIEGTTCVVTGAASGIGRATALALAERGCRLVLTDVQATELARTAERIRASGGEVLVAAPADITDHEGVMALAETVHAAHGSVDVVMNVAGISTWGAVENLAHSDWQRTIDIDLLGPISVIEAFVPAMIEAGHGGHLVNVSSAAGLLGLPWHAPYSAAKFGLRGVSEVLRFDLRRHRIGVSLVCPGGVDTPLVGTVDIVGVDRDAPALQKMTKRFQRHAVAPEKVAERIIRGVERERYLVFTSADIRLAFWLQRFSPRLRRDHAAAQRPARCGRPPLAAEGLSVRRGPLGALLALAAAVLLLVAAPARASTPLHVEKAKKLDGRLTELTMRTPALDFPVAVRILLPAHYRRKPHRRYPVLYLLHGSFDTAASWTDKGDAERITANRRLIVVMPAAAGTGNAGGWASDWRNEGHFGPPRWETFTIGQLIPWVDSHLRTRPHRKARAIAGLSMGGFSAMSYAARHPDLFAWASSFSGAVDTNYAPVWPVIEAETLADGGSTPDAIWGVRSLNQIFWRGHNPWDLARNLAGMKLSIHTGNGSPGPYDGGGGLDPIEYGVHEMSRSLHRRLLALGIPHAYDDYGPGTHSWPYWQRDLREDLPRIMRTFRHPRPRPHPFDYRSIEPRYGIYGWHVRVERKAAEWSSLIDVSRTGFAVKGSGAATVLTPGKYLRFSSHRVRVGGERETLRADGAGRLRIDVPLGPANPEQQYRPGVATRSYETRVRIGRALGGGHR